MHKNYPYLDLGGNFDSNLILKIELFIVRKIRKIKKKHEI